MVKYATNYCTLELCQQAGDMLKAVGFQHFYTSMKTEAAYYQWPDRTALLRVAAHSRGRSRERQMSGPGKVMVSITFKGNHNDPPGMMNIGANKIESTVANAIGLYFIRSAASMPATEAK